MFEPAERRRSRKLALLTLMAAVGVVTAAGCGTRQSTADIEKYENTAGSTLATAAAGSGGTGAVGSTDTGTGTSTGTGTGTDNGAAAQGGSTDTGTGTATAPSAGSDTGSGTTPPGSGGSAATGTGSSSGSGGSSSTGTGSGSQTGANSSSTSGANVKQKASAAPSSGSGGSTTAASNGSLEFPTCAKEGPPVTIGQVGSLSGLVGANLQGAIKAPYVWADYANAHGGLGCHPIKFVQMDDQSDPATSQADVETEVEKDGAVALFGAVVPLDISGFISGVQKEQVADIGGDQAATEWLTSPNLFPVGGTSRPTIAGSVKAAAATGKKKIAVLYCVEASPCGANFYDTIVKDGYAQKYGMQVVYSGSISITQPDFTAQCQNAKNAGADTIAWGLDKAGLQRAAKSCANIGYYPTLTLIALQSTFDPTDPNIRKSGAFLSAPVFTYVTNTNAAENEFFSSMKKYAPGAVIDESAAEVWADGMMLEKIVDALGPSAQTRALTKQDFFTAAGKIQNETLNGLIPPTTYKSTGPQAENPYYYPLVFNSNGTFTAPSGNTPENFNS